MVTLHVLPISVQLTSPFFITLTIIIPIMMPTATKNKTLICSSPYPFFIFLLPYNKVTKRAIEQMGGQRLRSAQRLLFEWHDLEQT